MFISVIIPVFNVEKYIEQCIESVINQTLNDIEIICVNDGSTDKSLEILKKYQQKDARIKILNQENKGAGAARNTGLNAANGEYIYFLDGDDYIEQIALEKLYKQIIKKNADICLCKHKTFDDETKIIKIDEQTLQLNLFKTDTISRETAPEQIFQLCTPQIALKLYKKSFIKKYDLSFQEIKTCNDVYFSLASLALAKNITYVNEPLLIYRTNRKNSLTITRGNNSLCIINAFNQLKDKLIQENVFNIVKNSFYSSALGAFKYELNLCNPIQKQEFLYKIQLFLPEKYYKMLQTKKQLKPLQKIFSLTNQDTHKVLTILGISIKFKRNPICFIKHIDKNKLKKQLNTCEYGITTKKRTPQLIVSLTSFPQRMYDIHFCLYSLLNQSLKPDRLILWLAEEEFPNKEKDIPNTVLSFLEKGLEIKWCKNIKSYKKLIPALKEYPDAITVTADDDIYYPVDWLEKLYQSYQKNPEYIHCHRAHKILFDTNNTIMPYKNWESETTEHSPSLKIFCTTGGGVLYPPQCLYKDVLNEELFTKLAPNADDIWFWAMALLQGTKIKVVDDNIKQLTYINPERELGLNNEITLCSQNCGNGQNDIQLANVLKQYPQIMEKLINE